MKATIICNIQISLAFHKQITYFINFFACIIFCKSKVMNWLASSSRVNFAIFQWFLYPWIWHSVKSAQIRSYFWPVFSCNRTRNNSVFGHFSRSNLTCRYFLQLENVQTHAPATWTFLDRASFYLLTRRLYLFVLIWDKMSYVYLFFLNKLSKLFFKDPFYGLRQISGNWKLFRNDEKCFCALFVLKIFKSFSWLFWSCHDTTW